MWTEKAHQRFKERIQKITSRSRGVSTFCMLRELKRYVVGWLKSHTQSPGLLVYGRDKHCPASAGQSLAIGAGRAKPNATVGRDALRQAESEVQSCGR